MRFDVFLRPDLGEQFASAADRIAAWREGRKLEGEDRDAVARRITPFDHTTSALGLRASGVDGAGEYPLLSVDGAFVHFTLAAGTTYEVGPDRPRELGPEMAPTVHAAWIPDDEVSRRTETDAALATLAGLALEEVIAASDYRQIKAAASGASPSTAALLHSLLRPHPADGGSIGLHLRTTAEFGIALRLIRHAPPGALVLVDGTLTLPLVERAEASLFHEHLKRLCCVEARDRNVVFATLSQSPGIPGIEAVESVARDLDGGSTEAEHWALRLPVPGHDAWDFPPTRDLTVPPAGAVSYLVRFHRTTSVLRLDLDLEWWRSQGEGPTGPTLTTWETRLFEDLDYLGHDLRSYGYPYPLRAARDRADLSSAERRALRQRLVDEALRRGVPLGRLRSPRPI